MKAIIFFLPNLFLNFL
jgi:hypothetical protein